jgi:hypothetical protein
MLYSLLVCSLCGAALHTRSEVSKQPSAFSLQSIHLSPQKADGRPPRTRDGLAWFA